MLGQVLNRRFAAQGAAAASGLTEIREYTLKPEGFSEFMKIAADYAGVRRELLREYRGTRGEHGQPV